MNDEEEAFGGTAVTSCVLNRDECCDEALTQNGCSPAIGRFAEGGNLGRHHHKSFVSFKSALETDSYTELKVLAEVFFLFFFYQKCLAPPFIQELFH